MRLPARKAINNTESYRYLGCSRSIGTRSKRLDDHPRVFWPIEEVQDFSMTIGFMNRRLRRQFEEKLRDIAIDPTHRSVPLRVGLNI